MLMWLGHSTRDGSTTAGPKSIMRAMGTANLCRVMDYVPSSTIKYLSSTISTVVKVPLVCASFVKQRYIKYLAFFNGSYKFQPEFLRLRATETEISAALWVLVAQEGLGLLTLAFIVHVIVILCHFDDSTSYEFHCNYIVIILAKW